MDFSIQRTSEHMKLVDGREREKGRGETQPQVRRPAERLLCIDPLPWSSVSRIQMGSSWGWREGTFSRVLGKPQFLVLFPPASSVTLALVRGCVSILISRNMQRSTVVLELGCSRNPTRHSGWLMGHASRLQWSPRYVGGLAAPQGLFAWYLPRRTPILAEENN